MLNKIHMEKMNEYAIQDPRDQESMVNPQEQTEKQEQTHRHPEEQENGAPTAIPDADNGDTVNPLQGPDTESSGFKKENLITVKNANEEDEEPEEEDEMASDEEEEDEDDESDQSPIDRQTGDDFTSPAKLIRY